MARLLLLLLGLLRSAYRSRADLMLENTALRHQLGVLMRAGRRPRATAADRCFWVVLRRLWSRWSEVSRVREAGDRRPLAPCRLPPLLELALAPQPLRPPRVATEGRALVRRLASENPTWGAPRVHGELRMLGFDVSERTVSRLMPPPAQPEAAQRWITFLRNHRDAIAAMDFFVVPTVTFRVLYVSFVIEHSRRRILHFHVTTIPMRRGSCSCARRSRLTPLRVTSSSTVTPSTPLRSSRP
jgi:putative transposase